MPYDGYYPMVYATEEPATFYIYGSSTSTYITGLKWEPLNTKAIPEITWSGSNTMTVGDVSDHIATAPSGLTIEYKVIKGITGLPEGTILTVTDGHLNFTPAAAGTLVIAAATEETTSYQAFSKTKAITVEKKDAVLSLGSALTGIYTVVGGKSRTTSTNTVAITAENIDWAISGVAGVTKADGDFSFSTDGVYGQLDGDGYLLGKALGNVTLTVIWTPRTDAAKTKLNEVKKTFTIEVKPGTLRLSFAYSTSTVSTDKSIMPYIIAQNESGEIVRGLKMLYTVTGVYATADAGQTYITAGSVEGSVTVTGNYVGASLSRAADTEPYYSASTSDNTDGDVIKTMTLYVQKPSTTGRLTLIPQTSDYQSDNMASLFWSNETNTSSADISLASPKFVMNSNYISSDNRFRLYASNNEELVDNEYIRGLKISEQDSYLSFFAQGSATLVLHGYASIARTIEIYAVNSQDYTGNATTDASLANASLVTSVKVDAGTFIKNVPMTLAGNNYYFVKTMNGGLYLSSIEWKSSLAIPTLTVTPSEITLDQEHHVVSLKNNFTTQAYLTQSETQYWIYDNSALKQASGNTESVTFTYSSLNDAVATVNSLTGVITPIRNGTVTMYITLEAGSVSDGDGGTKSYGSVRYPVSVNIPVGLQVVDEYFEKNEIVYSTVSSTNAVWQTPIIKKHGIDEDIIPDHIYYYLQDFEGNTISSEYAVIYNTDAQDSGGNSLTQATGSYSAGQVEIKSACPDNYQFRVIARLCGTTIVDQQAYYIVTVTKALTLPTISCSGAGIKELNVAPTLSSSYTSHDRREYYARANKQKETVKRSERNNVVSEEDVTMTITIPSSTPGLTLKAEVVSDFTTPPTTTLTEADGKYTLQISNPNSYTTKYVWVRIEDSSKGEWNGFYKITFFSAPNCQVSDYLDPAITPKTATFTTRNSGNPGTIYYTFDSSTPTAESHRYTDPIERTANTVYNVVEAYSPTGGFVNGTNNFTTNVMYNIELEITDPLVFEVVKGTEIHPNVSFAKTINDAEGSRQLRVMFGSDQVCVYKNSAFTTIGLKWEKGIDADTGIPSYVDIYSQYCSASMSSGTEQPNPYTEYNGGFGGSGSGLGTNVPAPYITPVSGAFFRFEPEYNGVVTVWIRQNGASGSSAYPNSDKESRYYLTRRPVFIMDETGTLIQRNTAPYSAEWDFDGTVNPATGIEDKSKAYRYINGSIADVSQQSTLDRDFMWGWNHLNSITTDTQWKTSWYAMDFYNKKYRFGKTMPKMDKSGTLDMFDYTNDYRSIPIVDIVYCDNEATDLDGQSFVLYGYELPMPNYVRYRIPVKAGKSYYMGGRGTRNAFCAVKFDNDHTTDHITTYQLQDKGTNDWTESINDGTQINVTLDRVFTAGKWSPIVLPFSVSESRLRDMFGDNTLVLTLDQYYKYNSGFEMPAAVKVGRNGVSADLMFTHHRYQMLYANTPAYICPTFNWKNVTTCPARTQDELDALSESVTQDANGIDCKNGVTFNRVTFVAGGVKTVDIGEGYEVTGSYAVTIGSENGEMYYLENVYSGTSWTATMYHSTEGVNMKAGRCWIHKKAGVNHAPPLTNIGMNTFDGTEIITESMSSGIVDVFADAVAMDSWQYNPNVYNLQGMTVGKVNENISIDDILNQLNSGIYIYQGKKYYVK